jgi:hypothetical protein
MSKHGSAMLWWSGYDEKGKDASAIYIHPDIGLGVPPHEFKALVLKEINAPHITVQVWNEYWRPYQNELGHSRDLGRIGEQYSYWLAAWYAQKL